MRMRSTELVLLAFVVPIALGQTPALAEVAAWFAPSATKVLRDAKPNPAAKQGDLAAARNETEACQLVLRSDQVVPGVVVRVPDLRLADGSAALPVKLFKVEYVPKIVGDTSYPDPLPPLKPLDLQPNQTQPVWISVKVPQDAKPGDYTTAVEVQAGARRIECPLRLHVWGFALPVTPSSATAFGLTRDAIARQHGVAVDSPEGPRLYARYYEMLLDHKVSAYTVPADLMSDEAAKYLDDPRMTSYQIPFPAGDDALKALVERLVKRGWYAKGFFYPIDEPVKKDAYGQLAKINERLHRFAPNYRWVVPFYRDPDWDNRLAAIDLLGNRVTIWCPISSYFDSQPRARSYLAARHDLGESLWWYVCCGPGAPHNNFFVDMSAMTHRLLFWQQKRENVQGLLYWDTTWWNPSSTKDPWTDMATVKDINRNIRGDGSLLYPGKQVGVDGPVSSIRLEMIRDGLEDFDYLTLSDAGLGKDATRGFVAKMARKLTDYEHDPLALEKVRRELGDLLEKKNPPAKAAR
jgi:hypothetical protein